MPEPLLHAHAIDVLRHHEVILKEVSLSVMPEDFITIIGPNGAGKTMLLKCMMGLFKPNSGSVTRRNSLRVGYMPQQFHAPLNLPLSVKGFLTLHKKNPSDNDINQSIHDVGIETLLHQPVHALSGGEMQRVLLTRALIGNPELLVLDEPAQNLDISGQLAFYSLLEKLYEERKFAVLMVSHDLHLVMARSKQVVCLFQHVCCHGEPQMVAKDPEFVSLFGEDMARMMAVYSHAHDHTHEDHPHD